MKHTPLYLTKLPTLIKHSYFCYSFGIFVNRFCKYGRTKHKTKVTGNSHIIPFAQHRAISHLCNDEARSWPEWNEFKHDSKCISIYGVNILLQPNHRENFTNYMLWSD